MDEVIYLNFDGNLVFKCKLFSPFTEFFAQLSIKNYVSENNILSTDIDREFINVVDILFFM